MAVHARKERQRRKFPFYLMNNNHSHFAAFPLKKGDTPVNGVSGEKEQTITENFERQSFIDSFTISSFVSSAHNTKCFVYDWFVFSSKFLTKHLNLSSH